MESWTERWGLEEEGGSKMSRWEMWLRTTGSERTWEDRVIKRMRQEQSPNNHLFNLCPFRNKSLSSFSLSTPPFLVCYPPPPFPSLPLHLHLSPSTRLPASEAKLHLINNGCCCLLHCWRRAGTLGNAGATFNWMGLLMRPAGETPSQRHPHPLYLPPLATHIHMHTLTHPSTRPACSLTTQCNFFHGGTSGRRSWGSVCGSRIRARSKLV